MSRAVRDDPASGRAPRSAVAQGAWIALAVALFCGFIALGNWQVRRLAWKRQLIHDVSTRVHAPPVAAPGPSQWRAIVSGQKRYLHVRLRGRFLDARQTLVHGTSKRGYGFWAMAPLRTDRGFVVLVNRGYLPATLPGEPSYAGSRPPGGEVTLTGLLRFSEPGGGFLRPNHPAKGLWYSRDVAALARAYGLPAGQVAPYFVDADSAPAAAGSAPRWPQAGMTVIQFPNHHLSYLITWYLLAFGVAAATIYLGWSEWYRRREGHEPSD